MAQGQETNIDAKALNEAQKLQGAAWNLTLAYAEPMAVKAVLLLGIPDIMVGAGTGLPMSVAEIAEKLPASPLPPKGLEVLRRIMRFLAATGFFTADHMEAVNGEIRYGLSAVAKCFVQQQQEQKPGSLSQTDMFLLLNDKVVQVPWHHFHECVTDGGVPFVQYKGMETWNYLAHDARFNSLFNHTMASHSKLITSVLLSSYGGFREVSSLLDIGGGTGALSEEIVKCHPNITSAINFDLPHVIATAPARPGVKHVAGNMFESMPSAECILLKTVLHNWDDLDCARILNKCRAALPANGGRLIILDIVLPDDSKTEKAKEEMKVGLIFDLLMATMGKGRERSAAEFRALLSSAGFSKMNIVPLPPPALQDIIEAFP